mmetsp:Transcript_28988/g.40627  ORF Transcript_28988/g.40627 Transcript_28988/m.40627 type:complete len:471 (+) Transcript_28988:274-1686(+)
MSTKSTAAASPTSIADLNLLTTSTKDNKTTTATPSTEMSKASDADTGDLQSVGDKSAGSLSIYSTDEENDTDILNKSFVRTILDSASQRTLDGPTSASASGSASTDIITNKKNGGGAPRVSFSGVDSVTSEGSLRDKTVDQLIEKVEALTLAKKQVQIDLSAEKAVRKKKERNLIKLAKELNKRAEEQKNYSTKAAKMDEKVLGLQEKLESTKQELEDIKEKHEKKSHEHHVEITALQDKYRAATKEHNDKTEELRREILEANLTADKLRSKLARLEMVHSPDHADMIAERTMRESAMYDNDESTDETTTPKRKKKSRMILPIMMCMIAIGVGIMHNMDLLSLNAMCGPVMPGTTYRDTNASSEAPWWTPAPLKATVFGTVCSSEEKRVRTRMEYTHHSGSGQHKLTLWSVPSSSDGSSSEEAETKTPPTLLWEKRVGNKVSIFSEHIVITDKRGKEEDVPSGSLPWIVL